MSYLLLIIGVIIIKASEALEEALFFGCIDGQIGA